MYNFIERLNENQRIAATTTEGPLLVLAGAGTGKTATMIARTAYIVAQGLCRPDEILVVTFTNKAAREMKERGEKLLGESGINVGSMPIFSTFHSWGVNFLKIAPVGDIEACGLRKGFTIADEDESAEHLKAIAVRLFPAEIELDEDEIALLEKIEQNPNYEPDNVEAKTLKSIQKREENRKSSIPEKMLIDCVGKLQNKMIPYNDVDETTALIEDDKSIYVPKGISPREFANLYVEYKKSLRKNNVVDFDDLINLSVDILKNDEFIRNIVRNQYKYIMVDEFQDSNMAQIKLLDLILNPDNKNICVVGDDAQSIYGWRGSQIEFILNFSKRYPNAKTINLIVNYRSDTKIIDAANELIRNSKEKHKDKEDLVSHSKDRGLLYVKDYDNGFDEARAVAGTIKALADRGVEYKDITVIYRKNMLNKALEKELVSLKIPYKIEKGTELLRRAVVKKNIKYFKYLQNQENYALLGAILRDAKVVTQLKLDKIDEYARSYHLETSDVLMNKDLYSEVLSKKQAEALSAFLLQVNEDSFNSSDFGNYKEFITKYMANPIFAPDGDSEQEAMKYLFELSLEHNSMEEFLDYVSLDSSRMEEEDANQVRLMTIHASKGLEFPFLFVLGATDDDFPRDNEESRRLFYVATTRAKNFLQISYAKNYIFNQGKSVSASPMILEIKKAVGL